MEIFQHVGLVIAPFVLAWLATKLDPDDQLTKPDEYYIMRVVACLIVGILLWFGNKYLLCQAMSDLAFMLSILLLLDLIINIVSLKTHWFLRIFWL